MPLRIVSEEGEILWSMADDQGRLLPGALARLFELASEVPLLPPEPYLRLHEWSVEELEEEVEALLEVDAIEGDRATTVLKGRILREEVRVRMDEHGEQLVRAVNPARGTSAEARDRLAGWFNRLGQAIREMLCEPG